LAFSTIVNATEPSGNFLINISGYIRLPPSNLVFEWGRAITDVSGVATVVFQHLSELFQPLQFVALPSTNLLGALPSNTSYSVSISYTSFFEDTVNYYLDVRKNVAGTVTAAPAGIVVHWLAIGF
jgi:hypothetical protein